jgi:hypothetical protein
MNKRTTLVTPKGHFTTLNEIDELIDVAMQMMVELKALREAVNADAEEGMESSSLAHAERVLGPVSA